MGEAPFHLLPCVYALLTCIGFSMLFNIHSADMLIRAGGGALGWLCYLLTGPLVGNDVIQFFFATLAISAWPEVMARPCKCPVTSYLLMALSSLVSGGGIYYTMEYALNGDTELLLGTLMHTLSLADTLAVGVLLTASVVRLLIIYQSRRRGRERRDTMPRYEVVLLDADCTLFNLDRAECEALRQTLEEAGLPADGGTEARYLSINRALWNRLDRGEVRREWPVVKRFVVLLRALGWTGDVVALNRAYLDHLREGSYLPLGAQASCRALALRCALAIVTSGVVRAQRRRLEAPPLNDLIPWLFISEELGASKSDPAFFAPVLHTLGGPGPRRVLMMGNNLLADIQGGIQAGLDTAWRNPGRLPGDPAVVPTWEVDGYAALQALILKEEKNNI